MAKEILAGSHGLMMTHLREHRVLRDDRENAIEVSVLPSLYATVGSFTKQRKEQHEMLDKMIAGVTSALSAQHKQAIMEEKRRREEIIKERMRLQREREAEK